MADLESEETVNDLKLHSIIGFDGGIVRGFSVHPDGEHAVYPLGNKISIQNLITKKQDFLSGHTNTISSIDVSPSGKYIASGQINHIGFKAKVILWDFHDRCIVSVHEIHKVRVEAVSFSLNDRYLISLGGRDCGSVVVWDVEGRLPLCGNQASSGIQGDAIVLLTTNRREACFLTGGDCTLQIWKIDREARNVRGTMVNLAKLRRVIMCMDLNERDEICYCGTTTGDVLKIRLNFHHDLEVLEPVKRPILIACYAKMSRKKLPQGVVDLYCQGIRSILLLPNGNLIIGAGDGTVDIVQEKKVAAPAAESSVCKVPSTPELMVLKTTRVRGIPTSLNLFKHRELFVGTDNCELYSIDLKTFEAKLLITCHTSTIYDIAFPYKFSDVFATAGKDDVRVWSISTLQELLRICVPNFICSKVVFAHDGKSILTGWNDGIIRAFTPLTGRLIYAILNAHNKGVSALAVTHHGKTIISGGCEGQVRLWKVTPYHHELMCTLKEHKGPVSAIHINAFDDEAASASTDGTCIIWDVMRQVRKQILFANTLFMCVRYFPTGVQIMTAGSDRKVSYWEVLDGTLVRELEGSSAGAINCLDISQDGALFVTGGNDQIVKLWRYQEGITTHIGLGHSAVITAACFSPNGKYIVSTSASGSIFVWEVPKDLKQEQPPKFKEQADQTTGQDEARAGAGDEGADEHINELETSRSQKSSDRDGAVKKTCVCPNAQLDERRARGKFEGGDEYDRESVQKLASGRSSQASSKGNAKKGDVAPDGTNASVRSLRSNTSKGSVGSKKSNSSSKNATKT